jgi:regulator of cell morphogenesis and NO signaling
VYRAYNERYGETLTGPPEVLAGLRGVLETHYFQKEERILFPAIAALEAGSGPSHACFGSVAQPIRMMEAEHANAGSALARIREITSNFAVPDYACITYRSLMAGLQELEQDLHVHIHLENNALFPRAIALESSAR